MNEMCDKINLNKYSNGLIDEADDKYWRIVDRFVINCYYVNWFIYLNHFGVMLNLDATSVPKILHIVWLISN